MKNCQSKHTNYKYTCVFEPENSISSPRIRRKLEEKNEIIQISTSPINSPANLADYES